MFQLLMLLWLLPSFLMGSSDLVLSEEEDPAFYQHVNVISGHLTLQFQDLTVAGAVPYTLSRSYSSVGALMRKGYPNDQRLQDWSDSFCPQGGWSFFAHTHLYLKGQREKGKMGKEKCSKKDYEFSIEEKNGSNMSYVYSEKKEGICVYKPKSDRTSNLSNLNARMNPQNNELHYDPHKHEVILYLADGGRRIYRYEEDVCKTPPCTRIHHYKLIKEISPDQHETHYEYCSKNRLKKIRNTGPEGKTTFSSLDVEIVDKMSNKRPYHFAVRASTGQNVEYRALMHEEQHYLQYVDSNCRPREVNGYIPGRKGLGARLQTLQLADQQQLRVSYYEPLDKKEARKWDEHPEKKRLEIDRVRQLEAPLGPGNSWVVIADFVYAEGHTDVRDAEHLLTRYYHDGKKMVRIEYFDRNDQRHSSVHFFWQGPHLIGKALVDSHGRPLFSKTFVYNDAKDVVEETFWGNLTGQATSPFGLRGDGALDNAESYSRFYAYDPDTHLRIQEREEYGLTVTYTYLPGTTLLTSKLTSDHDRILLREFFAYNSDNLMICHISDDGATPHLDDLTAVTQRHIERYTLHPTTAMPISIRESCLENGQERFLRRIDYDYSAQNRLIFETLYNAEETFCYTIHIAYDERGNVISRTTPSGYYNTYRYGSQGELLYRKEQGQLPTFFTYNAALLPLTSTEADFDGIHSRTTHFHYDVKGRLLSQTDPEGNTTTQQYDAFGQCRQTQFPQIKDNTDTPYHPLVYFDYDALGNLTQTNTGDHHTTSTQYNAYHKPVTIIDNAGTVTTHLYDYTDQLIQTTYCDGTTIHYTYDSLRRKTSETVLSSAQDVLSYESWHHNAFHLLSHTNPQGLTTQYSYDGAGLLIQEQAQERITTYTYNADGLLERKTQGGISQVTLYDISGLVVCQYLEDESGYQDNQTRFVYDQEGRKIRAIRQGLDGETIDHFSYDPRGRLCCHTDPLGASTHFLYQEVANDLGQWVVQKTTIDPIGLRTIETYDALGHSVSLEKQDAQQRTVACTRSYYDRFGNQTKQILTVYEQTTPSRTTQLERKYDARGRIIQELEYPGKLTTFSYTSRGWLATKTGPNGITLSYSYDPLGRLIEQRSSDGTIHYQYVYKRSSQPTEIHDLIHHTTLQRTYNLFDELIEEINPYNLTTNWTYDEQGRCQQLILPDSSSIAYTYQGPYLAQVRRLSSSNTPLYSHHYLSYDPNGHVLQESLIHNLGYINTTYDPLERPLDKCSAHHSQHITYGPSGLILAYTNTLIGDKQFTYDSLNQLSQENTTPYTFDSIGNPTKATLNAYNQILSLDDITLTYDPQGNPLTRTPSTTYTYDALNRLTSISTPTQTTTYTYDALDRLIRKQTPTATTLYLYDHLYEIGTCTLSGDLLELKVLGIGLHGDVGAAIAIELDHIAYAPLHDPSGNIIALIANSGALHETYPTDAFGTTTLTQTTTNPWRFSSKRSEDTGLILFGKRFYDPTLGRFLTPDPTGFADGPNLYLFVLNNPINRLDLFGLSSDAPQYRPEPLFDFTRPQINVPISKIPTFAGPNQAIHAKGHIGGIKEEFVIIYDGWQRLKITPEEYQKGTVNILDHLHELVPKEGSMIGIVTFQNGIWNRFRDLMSSCTEIAKLIPEGTLFIGYYNRTEGKFGDLWSAFKEQMHFETNRVVNTRQFLVAISEILYNINPNLFHLHLSHSRAGMVGKRAIGGMTPEQKARIKEQLLSKSFGAAKPIPDRYAQEADNVYSKNDIPIRLFAEKYKNSQNYTVRFIDSKQQGYNRWLPEHAFLGPTYQTELKEYFGDLKNKYGFYDPKIH